MRATTTDVCIGIPKTLADVLVVIGWEESTPRGDFGHDAPFRSWCSPCLAVRLFVYDRANRPCLLVWADDQGRPQRDHGGFAFVLAWLTSR